MTLPTAPCTRCRATVVYGEPQCRKCGQPFQYGAGNVPVPSPHQIQEALIAAAADAISGPNQAAPGPGAPPSPAPLTDGPAPSPVPLTDGPRPSPVGAPAEPAPSWLDQGRFDDVGQVGTEAIPGFIDSTLFGAFSAGDAATATMPGLETHHAPDIDVHSEDLSGVLDQGRFDDVGQVRTEDIPGFIDSSLFAAYTPDTVATVAVPGLESTANAGTRKGVASDEGAHLAPCTQCGTMHDRARCPSCGAAVLD